MNTEQKGIYMKLLSLLMLSTHVVYAHDTGNPNHSLTSPHHGSPLLWILLAITVVFFVYGMFKSKK